ncbi:MAG: class I SAM-dependent RNA methyltransferase [Gemmobacter sp.]|uniref:class I SAM-dependent RNA methyltransferase n=1 Tax=Gemmobacter sp. TaxID=1898957 RepID=UPI00391A1E69
MDVTVERLGHLGDGVARGPEGPVFVPGALPGEVVAGTLAGDRLEGARIVTPSPHRRKPPCAHARTCGGCALQHADDAFVARWKLEVVRAALAGQGLAAEVTGPATSPPQSRRRATLAGRRTKAGVTLGFHMRGADQLVAVPNCQLLAPGLMAAFPALEALVRAGASRKGELALTVTETASGPDVAVAGGKPLDAALVQDLAALAETHRLARLTWDAEVVALRAQPMVSLGKARVPLPPGAFLQATAAGEAALLAAVREAVGPARKVVDLFAGCGTFALPLAETAEVHAVEGDAALTAALAAAARTAPGLKPVTVETRDLFRRPLLPDECRCEAVVIDPPRAGAEAQVAEIARARVPVVAMVSCNPVTFARDARALVAAGYRLGTVQVVDQFRWSTHVELAARFALG